MLINCAAYRDGSKCADLRPEEIGAWRRRQRGGFVWVALRDASDAELRQMQQLFGLHALALEDARHGQQRPKLEEYGATLFLVIRLLEAGPGGARTGEVAIFAGPDFVLSVRQGSRQHFLGVRERCEREPRLLRHGPGFVCYALMDAAVDRYFPFLEAIEADLDGIEAQI
ncbi:MAG: magnesium transporter, partial [Burkholderiaceae bacterium]